MDVINGWPLTTPIVKERLLTAHSIIKDRESEQKNNLDAVGNKAMHPRMRSRLIAFPR